jgi:hypothetical protein
MAEGLVLSEGWGLGLGGWWAWRRVVVFLLRVVFVGGRGRVGIYGRPGGGLFGCLGFTCMWYVVGLGCGGGCGGGAGK